MFSSPVLADVMTADSRGHFVYCVYFLVSLQKHLKNVVKVISSGGLLYASYLTVFGDESFYANNLMPPLRRIVEAEMANRLSVKAIGLGLVPFNRYQDPSTLVSGPSHVCTVNEVIVSNH